jgi:hypothetical protein
MESLIFPLEVDSQSVDIGHGDGMTSGAAVEQVTLPD